MQAQFRITHDVPVLFRAPPGGAGDFCLVKSRQNRPPGARGAEAAPSLRFSLATQLHTRGIHASRVKAPPSWRRPSAWLARCDARLALRGQEKETRVLLNPLEAAEHWTEQGQPEGAKAGCRAKDGKAGSASGTIGETLPSLAPFQLGILPRVRRFAAHPFFSPLFFGRAKKRGPCAARKPPS